MSKYLPNPDAILHDPAFSLTVVHKLVDLPQYAQQLYTGKTKNISQINSLLKSNATPFQVVH